MMKIHGHPEYGTVIEFSDDAARAAEILAAEASERARIVAWLDEQYCLNDDCRLDMIAAIKRNEHGAGK